MDSIGYCFFPIKMSEKKLDPIPKLHGSKTEKYLWEQTLGEVTAYIKIPKGLKPKDLVVKITSIDFLIGIKGKEPMINEKLYKPIKSQDTIWQIEGETLTIHIQKQGKNEWWSALL